MADNNSITGSVVGKIRFNIDKASWDNLENFKTKLAEIKAVMSGMSTNFKVEIINRNIAKVADATVKAEQKIATARKKIQKQDTMTSHVSMFQQNLKQQKIDAKFKARGGKYDEGVESFRVVKEQQLRSTAKMRGWTDPQREDAERALAKSIEHWKGEANGSIGMFRAQVNTVMRDLQVTDAVARKSALSFRGLRQELVQLTAAYTAFSLAQNVAQTGFEFESLRASARVFAKDDAGVAEHMTFIANEAQRLGIDLQTATKEFTKFSIATQTSMTKAEQRDLFTGMSEYSRVLGLNKQDYERAFRAVQQMASKGQVYKEELTGQLGESMGGSVQAMMRAAGFTNEKDFFKAIEAGKILTKDVLPKFSQELRKMSREGGALDKTMNSTPAQFARFMAAVTNAKLAFYDGGMNEGLGYMFKEFTTILQSMNPAIIALGKIFKGAAMAITFAFKAMAIPFQFVIKLFENFGEILDSLGLKNAGGVLWTLVGGAGGGVLLMMASKFGIVAAAVRVLNTALLTTLARLAPFLAAYAAIEDVFLYMKYGDKADTATGDAINFLKTNNLKSESPFLYSSLLSSGGMQRNLFAYTLDSLWKDVKIIIEPSGEGFDKVFNARLEKSNQAKAAATQSEVAQ